MTNPSVTMVALYADRPEFAEAILKVFRSQTYENKWLLIYDNGRQPFPGWLERLEPREALVSDLGRTAAIGELRNFANTCAASDIIVHGDSDDWSHPNRITEQVALLQASGADVVGYNEMLFWREKLSHPVTVTVGDNAPSEATLYTNEGAWLYKAAAGLTPALGTSLAYWRKTWERKPFNPALPKFSGGMSEETEFLRGLKCEAVSAMGPYGAQLIERPTITIAPEYEPRMIARIHGSNFGKYDIENQIARGSNAKPGEGWTRATEWDNRVREILG